MEHYQATFGPRIRVPVARRDPATKMRDGPVSVKGTTEDPVGITWKDADLSDTVLVSLATGLTAYDSAYLALAGLLGAELVTLDEGIATACAQAAEL